MNDRIRGVMLQSRTVPFPRSVSQEAQAALARMVREDGMPLNALYEIPAPEEHDAWRSIKAAANAHYADAVKGLASTLRSGVETVEIGQTTIHIATPVAPIRSDCAYIDLHGGALVFGGGDACRSGAQMQADQHQVRCYGVDYRMPPEDPYPAALDDCLAAYRYVLVSHAPENIVIGGRSAGGNLAVATVLRGRDEGLPLPAGLVLLSPEVDLTESGDSFEVNRMIDVVLPGSLMSNNRLYAAGADLAHPYLSPLFGDLEGLPPTFLQTGTRDLFLSNTVRMHRSLCRAGVLTELHVFEAMPHGGFMGGTPEDIELAEEISRFVRCRWNDHQEDKLYGSCIHGEHQCFFTEGVAHKAELNGTARPIGLPSVEDWQSRVDRLQKAVCMLLAKNQTMRMASLSESRQEEESGKV